jgi:hypothetical protein
MNRLENQGFVYRWVSALAIILVLAVVCWSGICGLGSLETDLLDPRNTPQIQPETGFSQGVIEPSSQTNKLPLEQLAMSLVCMPSSTNGCLF